MTTTTTTTTSSSSSSNPYFSIHGFYLSLIILLVSLLVSSNTSYYRLESVFNQQINKFISVTRNECNYSNITPSSPSVVVEQVGSNQQQQQQQDFIVIPPDLLIKKVNIIWKTKSNITKNDLDLIWKTADTRTDWSSYSKFSSTQSSEDLYINKLSRTVALPMEKLMHRLSIFVNEKFLIQSTVDGLESHPNTIPEYEKYVILKGMPFIIRYTAQEGKNKGKGFGGIGLHKDNSDISFILLLNDPKKDFSGGGTHFPILNKTIELEQGEVLVFSGQLVHGAVPITRGKRFVLSGFLTFSEDYLKMKRLATMETLGYLH